MGRRGQKQGNPEGEGDGGNNGGLPPQASEGKGRKGGKGYGKADQGSKGYLKGDNGNGWHQPHNGDGKGPANFENGWKGHGKNGNGRAVDAPTAAYNQPSSGQKGGARGGRAPGRGGKEESKRPLQLDLPKHEEFPSTPPQPQGQLWPITPLGLPRTPPPLPPINPHLGNGFLMPSLETALEESSSPSLPSDATAFRLPPAGSAPPKPSVAEEWTPVDEQQCNIDRRTFFHTAGRPLAWNPGQSDFRKSTAAVRQILGASVSLKVEEVHFGNPRVRIMAGEPAPMPQMLKWPLARYDEHVLDVAEIDFGDFRVWSAIGIRSNRLLYAMKRLGVTGIQGSVVAPPLVES